MTDRRLSDAARSRIDDLLTPVDDDLARLFPGDRDAVQPAHTVYVSAADADPETPARWAEVALGIEASAPAVAELAGPDVRARVREPLTPKPIEDLRID
ncbi:MAG: aldolase, partial [Gordonia sp. (in: high G+C Gram-positive bacteria)]